MAKPKLLFIGFAVADIIEKKVYLGGAAGSMSINATQVGFDASLLAPLSKDRYGLKYKKFLDKAGVDYSLCDFSAPHLPTCKISDSLGVGSTRNWQDNGALAHFLHMPIPAGLDQLYNYLFMCNAWADVGEKVAKALSRRCLFYIPGPKVVNDPGWIRSAILDKTVIIFCNAEESPFIWKSQPFKHGVEIVVATEGKNGGKIYLANGQIIPYDAEVVANVVDPTGAGDCFSLGFVSGWLPSHDIISGINAGSKLSTECIQVLGAILPYEKT